MLSLASLLNPAPPGPPINRFPPSPALSSPTTSFADDSSFLDRHMIPKHKMPKDAAVFTKSKPKGVVNFLPFERLDQTSLRQVRKFQVYPLGKIQEYSRHIPYNSGKKDFYEKTGRESFEVFQYVFRVPGDDTEYTVMWDYNVGLVRMTPFFKCCKYPKTTPAKMLNSNPGLKEITHSITGGSIMAQGYWMPYHCAKAVCATFCHNIAGALIPIFGPSFPSLCTPSEAPEYSRMIIDPAIVVQSTREADYFRRQYNNHSSTNSNNSIVITSFSSPVGNTSPKRDRRLFRSPYDDSGHQPRPRVRKTFSTTSSGIGVGGGGICDSPYATDTDGDISPVTTDHSSIDREQHQRFIYSPIPPPVSSTSACSPATLRPSTSWTPANVLPHPHYSNSHPHSHYETPGPSPWLSAVPRFTTTAHLPPPPPPPPPAPPAYPSQHSQLHSHSQTNSHSHSHSRSHPHLQHYHQQHHHHNPHRQHQQQPQQQSWRPNGNSISSSSNSSKRSASHIDHEHEHVEISSNISNSSSSSSSSSQFPNLFPSRSQQACAATTTTATTNTNTNTNTNTIRNSCSSAKEEKKYNYNNNSSSIKDHSYGDRRTSGSKPGLGDAAALGADKKAALLLMNLSVRDRMMMAGHGGKSNSSSGNSSSTTTTRETGAAAAAAAAAAVASGTSSPRRGDDGGGGGGGAFPRIKRVRSNSM